MLNNCIDCGSDNIKVLREVMEGMPEGYNHPSYRVECQKCLNSTLRRAYSQRESAITVWNRINKKL